MRSRPKSRSGTRGAIRSKGSTSHISFTIYLAVLALAAIGAAGAESGGAEMGRLEVVVTEEGTSDPLPCRVHLTSNGQPVYAEGFPRWEPDEGFCCGGRFTVDVPPGTIRLIVERGPEWNAHTEAFALLGGQSRQVAISLSRWIDMNARGWFSGDLHAHRPPADMPLLMHAEDLNVAPVITHWNQSRLGVVPPYLKDAGDPGQNPPRPRFCWPWPACSLALCAPLVRPAETRKRAASSFRPAPVRQYPSPPVRSTPPRASS